MEQNMISLLPLISWIPPEKRISCYCPWKKSLVYWFMLLWKISCEWFMQMRNKGVIILSWLWHLLWVTWAAVKRPRCIDTSPPRTLHSQWPSIKLIISHSQCPGSSEAGAHQYRTGSREQIILLASKPFLSLFLIWFIIDSIIPPWCVWMGPIGTLIRNKLRMTN